MQTRVVCKVCSKIANDIYQREYARVPEEDRPKKPRPFKLFVACQECEVALCLNKIVTGLRFGILRLCIGSSGGTERVHHFSVQAVKENIALLQITIILKIVKITYCFFNSFDVVCCCSFVRFSTI